MRFIPTHVGSMMSEKKIRFICRFIPTHVGSMPELWRRRAKCPVHPHTRGEHLLPLRRVGGVGGSSPHTWGASAADTGTVLATRFIPTHVGSMLGIGTVGKPLTVHPHTRGEHCSLER